MSIVAEAVAGAALSAFFDVLFDKLSSSDLLKIFQQENVDADLKKWKKTLEKISEVLDDAEDKQMTKGSVKTWLGELEDLAYDADDILDEFATEALRRKLKAEKTSTSKIRKFIPACCVSFNPSSIVFDVNMLSKIKEINTRLQKIVTYKEDLELIKNTERRRTRTTRPRPHTTSLVNEGHTYGRDKDKETIVKLLLESGDAQLSVIPIVGMGGLGKTTLAQLVYEEVNHHFELKAWVCVSEDFDNLRLTKQILRSFISESCHDNNDLDSFFILSGNDLDSLQRKLKNTLLGKKFLLILDDVWNENYELWTELCKPFESGALGSKIVVTTRNDDVSLNMGTTPAYRLKELSRDACLRVFTHHALGKPDFSENPGLEEFGQKIVDRCKGAPLAAKVLGGLLRAKHDPYEWKNVLNSKIWDISEEKGTIFSGLKLSYNYLPSYLKRCFAYCSLFPKDYLFEEKKLVLLWMAEGLIQEIKEKSMEDLGGEIKEKSMEDLGGEYFRDLLNRSFFQQSSSHESLFIMHDLMHDLAQWAAGDLCCRLEHHLGGSEQFEISTKVRRFSYIAYTNDSIIKVDDFPKDMHLRTFLLVLQGRDLSNFDANCLLPQLRYLRVLSLDGYKICELPSSIGDLKHLRYLNLSSSKIISLPESTSSLHNLQTLLLKDCSCLTKLPEKIENLVNLRHLDITNANSIIEMPVGIAKLKSLRTLSNFVVGKDKMVDLMNLESLQGTLCISHLENMLDANDASKVNLKGKKNLDTLVMEWNDDLEDAGAAIDILDMLRPHGTMKTLSIKGYVGAKFPTWLGDHSFSNMVDMRIERCGKCRLLPSFGQLPFLKSLIIKRMDGIRSVGLEFYGEHCKEPFRCLVKLCFEDMCEWQDWSSCNQDFPCLHELSISGCPKLQGKLPHHLPSLKKLSIYACQHLVVPIPSDSKLQEVEIVGCKDVVHGSLKVEKLIIENCELTSLCEDGLRSFETLKIEIKSCQSLVNIKLKSALRKLTIEDCNALESLQFVMDEGGASSTSSLLMNVEKIKIKSCQSLVNIKLESTLRKLSRKLSIKGCNALESLQFVMYEGGASSTSSLLMDEEKIEIESCQSLVNIKLKSTLRKLTIKGCNALESLQFVMDEGGVSSTSSLMNEENLSCIGNNSAYLPMLKRLDIEECPNLTSLSSRDTLPTTLEFLRLIHCPKLESIVDKLNKDMLLEDLTIFCCEKLRCLPRGLHELCPLKEIYIGRCNSLISLGDLLPTNLRRLDIIYCEKLEALPINMHNLNSLQDLLIEDCPSIISFPEEGFPTNLRLLHISCCEKLEALPINMHNLNSLQDLVIGDCPSIISFPEEGFPTNLRLLHISCFEKLEALPINMHNLNSLQDLSIEDCPSIISFPEEGFPPNLTRLRCEKLEALPINMHNLNSLQDLSIRDCPSIISFPEEGFPTNLKDLGISCCEKLEALPINMHNLNSLEDLSIEDCPSIISFPEEGFPTNLRSLHISGCEKLEALPINMHNLNFLQDLSIEDCPSIISFPEEGFPTNLRELRLLGANLCEQVFELGLHRLTSLTLLEIRNGIMDSFPEEEDGKTMLMLPTSLTTLRLRDLPNLLFLSWKFFQNLSALEEISIADCPKLASLSEKCFPPSLQKLAIKYCPVLEQNCEEDKGIMWSKIANIPSVMINYVPHHFGYN